MARQQTEHAAAAKMIRHNLKAAFPAVTFRVTSKGYSGGDSVSVTWTDGPTDAMVERIVGQYQEGSFDGSIDLYEYTNVRKDIPQSRWVHTRRDMSRETYRATVAYLNQRFGWSLVVDETAEYNRIASGDEWQEMGLGYKSHQVNPTFHYTPLLCGRCQAPTMIGDTFCAACGFHLGTCARCGEEIGQYTPTTLSGTATVHETCPDSNILPFRKSA